MNLKTFFKATKRKFVSGWYKLRARSAVLFFVVSENALSLYQPSTTVNTYSSLS